MMKQINIYQKAQISDRILPTFKMLFQKQTSKIKGKLNVANLCIELCKVTGLYTFNEINGI